MQDMWTHWRKTGFVIDKKTGESRMPTWEERRVLMDETKRHELRAAAETKKDAARERKRNGYSRWRRDEGVGEECDLFATRGRKSSVCDLTFVGHRFYVMVAGRGLSCGGGQRDQSWKCRRRTKWRIRRPGKRHFEQIRFRREDMPDPSFAY